MKKIGIDLDEVLAHSVEYVLEYHNYKINGTPISFESISDYHLENIFDIDIDTAVKRFYEGQYNDKEKLLVQPLAGSKAKLLEMKNQGYTLKIITARNEKKLGKYTYDWIEKYYKDIFHDIIFANHYSELHRSKADICKDQKIKHMIEDNPHYARELGENNIKTYLLEKPWNKHIEEEHKNIIKVKSWKDIII